MVNVFTATTIPSLRHYWRKFTDYLRFILPEIALIVGSVLILLGLIKRFFFTR